MKRLDVVKINETDQLALYNYKLAGNNDLHSIILYSKESGYQTKVMSTTEFSAVKKGSYNYFKNHIITQGDNDDKRIID